MIEPIKTRIEAIIKNKGKIKDSNILSLLSAYSSTDSDDNIRVFFYKLVKLIGQIMPVHKEILIEIHSGAGGEDAEELAEIFFKSYQKFLLPYSSRVICDISSGTGTIIANIPLYKIQGEHGVHRIVRVHNGKKHTSFVSVSVCPIIPSTTVIIDEKDLIVKTCRASGAGGQHVNKTESAVSITHIPTRINVRCENERSQHQNKKIAMDILYSKLQKLQQIADEKKKNILEKQDISWSNHFRTYSLYAPLLIQDNRMNIRITSHKIIDKVLYDGNFEIFTEPYILEYYLNQCLST